MRNLMFLAVLALVVVIAAGCTGVSEPPQIHSDIPNRTVDTPAQDTWIEPLSNYNTTVAIAGNAIPSDETKSYPVNFTDAYKDPMTGEPFLKANREQFLEVNRAYIAGLAKQVGEEKAKKIVNDDFSRLIAPRLLDPASGEDTLISIVVDPVGKHFGGDTFDITGSTNLPSGRELTIVIFRGNYLRAIPPGEDPWHDPVLRTAVVQANPSSKNTWSYSMNTTGLIRDDYLVYVRETQNDMFLTNTLFHLY